MKHTLILAAVVAAGMALGLYLGGRKDAKDTIAAAPATPAAP